LNGEDNWFSPAGKLPIESETSAINSSSDSRISEASP
jgi:hypothetical protein